jgi:hypothetical protein
METTQHVHSTRMPNPAVLRPEEGADLKAYNAVFSELGLRFRWNSATLEWLDSQGCDTEKARITTYLRACEPHLLTAYDADFLSHLICSMKGKRCGADDLATA